MSISTLLYLSNWALLALLFWQLSLGSRRLRHLQSQARALDASLEVVLERMTPSELGEMNRALLGVDTAVEDRPGWMA